MRNNGCASSRTRSKKRVRLGGRLVFKAPHECDRGVDDRFAHGAPPRREAEPAEDAELVGRASAQPMILPCFVNTLFPASNRSRSADRCRLCLECAHSDHARSSRVSTRRNVKPDLAAGFNHAVSILRPSRSNGPSPTGPRAALAASTRAPRRGGGARPFRFRPKEAQAKTFRRAVVRNPLRRLVLDERIQGNPRKSRSDKRRICGGARRNTALSRNSKSTTHSKIANAPPFPQIPHDGRIDALSRSPAQLWFISRSR